jgi:[acyl-carrier-protein] S-malonyltransferase
MPMTAFLFPGQGSQTVGMRAKLGPLDGAQRALFEQADEALELELARLIDEGPQAELTRTSRAQPALLAMDVAHALGLRARGVEADVVLGHSLGEYAALVWAGVLAFPDALELVGERGRLMEAAASRAPGGMAAVLRVSYDDLAAVVAECRTQGVLAITNVNAPGQLVLSGETAALDAAARMLRERKLGRAVPLAVSAPFHCALMRPVAEAFRAVLEGVPFAAPRLKFIDNVTGKPEAEPERIRQKLVEQIVSPVLWEPGVRSAAALGVERLIECGPGAVLTGLAKRILPGVRPETAEALAAAAPGA